MDRLKLQWKIFAYLIGFSSLLLIVLWLFQTVLLDDMYKAIRKNEINKAITLVEKHINSSNLQDIIHTLQAEKEIIVSPTQEFRPPAIPMQPNSRMPKPETITRTKVFALQNGQRLSLTFYAMITPVEATASTLRLQLYGITGIMVLLSVGLALIIARRVSKPIVVMNTSAKKLATGNYNTRFSGHGFIEIKELSDTLNTAATELSKVENLRRELMANISHDLRTPLSLIYSYAEMMHDFPEEISKEQTQVIMEETIRLTSLVNDILDVSKLESGTIELNPFPYNLTESIYITINRVSELVKKDGYTLSFCYDQEVTIVADELKMTQVLYNLLLNGITHGGDNKQVMVRQSVIGNEVKVEIIDHGEGIASEHLPYIWDRYYKVEKNHKRPISGTGLGLSIVKKIVEHHGGSCGVDSTRGDGSIFWYKLKVVNNSLKDGK